MSSLGNPMDFEATIEFYSVCSRDTKHALKRLWLILPDAPNHYYTGHADLPIEPQTQPNLTLQPNHFMRCSERFAAFEPTNWNFIGHDPKRVLPLWSRGAGLLVKLP